MQKLDRCMLLVIHLIVHKILILKIRKDKSLYMFACCKVNVDFQVTCKMYMYYEAVCHACVNMFLVSCCLSPVGIRVIIPLGLL